MIRAGAACVDITPPPGLMMAGFAARMQPATGAHDKLMARAVVVGDTALVAVDLLGLPSASGARIRARCSLPEDRVALAAIHTHGAPNPAAGRYGGDADPGFVARVEDGCVAAIEQALESAEPATISAGTGADPDIGRNRRHEGGPVDGALPVIRLRALDGREIAVIVSYACHPVVLGADNRLMTADYPHFVRAGIEAALPGTMALFLTGCAGDVNLGHKAHESWTDAPSGARTFARAEACGARIAEAALAAPMSAREGGVEMASQPVHLAIERRETDPSRAMAAEWRRQASNAAPVERRVFEIWADWADRFADRPTGRWTGRVVLMRWAGAPIVVLPGEIFAATGLDIRAACGGGPAIVAGYAEGIPGYIPPADEYRFGGYEVEESHRFAGRPGAFVPGSAEKLADIAKDLLSAPAGRGDNGRVVLDNATGCLAAVARDWERKRERDHD